MNPETTVGFVCVGAQKSGTTALFEYLRQHPNLQLADCKEVHFFDDETRVDWESPDYEAYHAAFAPADGRVRGDITPIYMYWPNSIERIRAYNPSMRVIMLFREPIARAYSHWRMETARGLDDQPFSRAIREGRARVDDPTAPGHHRVYSYVERGFYARQVERVRAVFPEEQALLLRARDLVDAPGPTLDRLCDFLAVPRFAVPPAPLRANVGPGPDRVPPLSDEDRAYLRDLFADDRRRFTALTGLDP